MVPRTVAAPFAGRGTTHRPSASSTPSETTLGAPTGGVRETATIAPLGHGMPPEMLEQTGVRGVGIAGMRERLQYLGGRLEIDSGNGGTTVHAVLPWKGHPK